MLGESAFRPYYKPSIPHTAAGYETQVSTASQPLYSSPEPRQSSSPGGKERTRRRRTTFTPEQTAALEREYVTDRYMDSSKRASLAESLSLNEVQVKTWFQNRRAKDKKEGRREDKPASPVPSKSATPPALQEVPLHLIPEAEKVEESREALVQEAPPPVGKIQPSPSDPERLVTPPSGAVISPHLNTVTPATAPIPTSYADYLSLGLNPAMSITAPLPYGSVYDVYGSMQHDYSGFLQAPPHSFFSALSTLDPQAVGAPQQQPLAHL